MKKPRIIVCIKQVPDTADVRIDPKTNSLVREGVPSIVNPEDRNAVEAALVLKKQSGGSVTAVTMGPPQAEEALREVVAMGVDKAVLLSDRAFAGSDTLITAFVLSRGIMKTGRFDLIICGRQAIDGDTAHVGPQIAAFLDIAQVTYVEEIEPDGDGLKLVRDTEMFKETVRAGLPCLITVTSRCNTPRYPSLKRVADACDPERIIRWTAGDINVAVSMAGLAASPTMVRRIFEPERKSTAQRLEGSEKEMARQLVERLKALQVL